MEELGELVSIAKSRSEFINRPPSTGLNPFEDNDDTNNGLDNEYESHQPVLVVEPQEDDNDDTTPTIKE